MVGVGGRIWTDTAPIKRRRARPHLSELGCHGRSLRGATAASQLCTPGVDWRGVQERRANTAQTEEGRGVGGQAHRVT